ncbi:MAG: peptide deformylase [Candidatus Spechtbacterales bacterium]|nr:peptide deformylase [Candidatus Spechtbacterales bacterium]
MAIKDVVQNPDPVLHKKAEPIKDFKDENLDSLIEDMKDTVVEQDGAGLAAPQIGVSKAVFVIPKEYAPKVRIPKKPHSLLRPVKQEVFINPRILKYGEEKQKIEEGCLSIKGVYHPTTRSYKATIEAQDENGRKFRVKGEGLLARIFQHETDHLNGMLFIDRLHEK